MKLLKAILQKYQKATSEFIPSDHLVINSFQTIHVVFHFVRFHWRQLVVLTGSAEALPILCVSDFGE